MRNPQGKRRNSSSDAYSTLRSRSSCTRSIALAFFFSSRRRHTRFDCDWSSDVCSSDLTLEEKNDRRRRLVGQRRPVGLRFQKDRKSTRLNSSHSQISYAVFCLKKKKKDMVDKKLLEKKNQCGGDAN